MPCRAVSSGGLLLPHSYTGRKRWGHWVRVLWALSVQLPVHLQLFQNKKKKTEECIFTPRAIFHLCFLTPGPGLFYKLLNPRREPISAPCPRGPSLSPPLISEHRSPSHRARVSSAHLLQSPVPIITQKSHSQVQLLALNLN